MAAGIWAARLGLTVELLEARAQLGGQLLGVLSPVTDYPGIQDVDGPALAARFVEHLLAIRVPVRFRCRVATVDPEAGAVVTTAGERIEADAIVFATGARRRRLGLPGEQGLAGRGVSYSVSKDRQLAHGKVAVVVGGGDSAVEGASRLAATSRAVHVVHRSPLVARPDFVAAAEREPRVHWHAGRKVERLLGTEALEGVVLDDGTRLDTSALYIRIGVEPQTELVRDVLPVSARGFLIVDADQRCRGRVYAVGDVCSPTAMAVSVATGQAMIACKHIQSSWI
jgi:thioredoxin reductase (NADPH)